MTQTRYQQAALFQGTINYGFKENNCDAYNVLATSRRSLYN